MTQAFDKKLDKIRAMRDSARAIIEKGKNECTLDPPVVEARLIETTLTRVLKVLESPV